MAFLARETLHSTSPKLLAPRQSRFEPELQCLGSHAGENMSYASTRCGQFEQHLIGMWSEMQQLVFDVAIV